MDCDEAMDGSFADEAGDQRERSGSCAASALKRLSLNVNPNQPPNGGEPCGTLVAYLKHFHVGGDEEFTIKALESLIKKLKDKRSELDILLRVVAKQGNCPEAAECVTIPRTLDGRLQVAGRKGFPHVVYAKIWRWPDLHKNELKHVAHCTAAFEMKTDSVCVNPYHYERIESPPGLPGFDGQHFPNAGSPLAAPPAANLNGMLHQNGELNGDASNPFAQFTLEALRALAFQTNLGSLDLGSAAALLSNPLFFNPSPQASIFPLLPESLQSMEMEESQAPLDEGQEAPMVEGRLERSSDDEDDIPWLSVQYHEKKGPLGQSFELERGHDYLTLGMAPGTGPTYDISGIENPERTEGAARARQWLSEGGVTVMIRNRSILLRSTLSRPVFVRSPYLNRQVHADLSSPSPHHVYSGSDLTIFVIDDFRHAINDYVKQVMSTRFDLGDNDHQDEEEPGQGTSSSCNGSHPPATKKQRTEAEKPRMEVDCDALLRTCATFEVGLAENELGSHPARIEDFECWFQFTVCQLGLEVERAVEVLA